MHRFLTVAASESLPDLLAPALDQEHEHEHEAEAGNDTNQV
jgi:hypothetical protein